MVKASPKPPFGTVVPGTAPVEGGNAQIVYRPMPGGRFTFSICSVSVGGCLFRDAALQRLVKNALQRACSRLPDIASFAQQATDLTKFHLQMEGNPGAGYILEHSPNLGSSWKFVSSFNLGTLEGGRSIFIQNSGSSGF